ncbi:hypothetical protein MKW94_023669 [Papaver nudicaule]|uniref:Malectin-like domain-containing protein n=1 Tax=Papaver nudicaule TaxID=74823 RepID=A0AA41RK49_PAPNU|nr:hypothetical protein [Papaver nudicaule]
MRKLIENVIEVICELYRVFFSMKNSKNHVLFSFLTIYLSLLVHEISGADSSTYVPLDNHLLNCGSTSELKDTDGRKWEGDNSKFAPSVKNTLTSRAATQDPAVAEVPYMTARIFTSNFTYSIPAVGNGRISVRLHFYPASYDGRNASNAIFSVSSGGYTLLKNFSVLQTAQALHVSFIVKEFSVNVGSGRVNITFTPSLNYTNSYAFVNGIEVISMPDIYSSDAQAQIVGQGQGIFYSISNATALAKVVRLNVGGKEISPVEDTGLFRSWSDDSSYIYAAQLGVTNSANPSMKIKYDPRVPPYAAPESVYLTARTMGPSPDVNKNYNLTWLFSVDPGFFYLVRLHFCEIQSVITKSNQRVFKIFLNNQTVADQADVVSWTGSIGNGIAVFKDYVVNVPKGEGQRDLWLELHPNTATNPNYYDAILNGLEIFKLSDPGTGNLAGPNPIPAPVQKVIEPSDLSKSEKSANRAGIIAGGVIGGVLLYVLFV